MGQRAQSSAFQLTPGPAEPIPHYGHGRHIWTVELPSGQLSAEHREEVRQAIGYEYSRLLNLEYERNPSRGVPESRSTSALIKDFQLNAQSFNAELGARHHPYGALPWQLLGIDWVVRKGPITGTFPKRLSTWINGRLPKYFDAPVGCDGSRQAATFLPKFPPQFFADLGARLGPKVNASQPYHLEFRDRIDWTAGEFGDKGSCYWGSYAHAKNSLAASGRAFALCAYRDATTPIPWGRCWGLLLNERDSPSAGVILCNAYGLPLITFARLLSSTLGLNYELLRIHNAQVAEWPAGNRPPGAGVHAGISTLFINRINAGEFGGYYLGTADQCAAARALPNATINICVDYVNDPTCSCGPCARINQRCSTCGAWDRATCNVCGRARCCDPCTCCHGCYCNPCVCCRVCHQPDCICCRSCRRAYEDCECPPCPVCRSSGYDCSRGFTCVAMLPRPTRRYDKQYNLIVTHRYADVRCPMHSTTIEQRRRFRELMATPTGKFARGRHGRIWTSIVEGMYQQGALQRPAPTERDEPIDE